MDHSLLFGFLGFFLGVGATTLVCVGQVEEAFTLAQAQYDMAMKRLNGAYFIALQDVEQREKHLSNLLQGIENKQRYDADIAARMSDASGPYADGYGMA